jgi:uncharacterized paraquat-inducible protein A
MELKLCPKCEKPYLDSEEFCPRCPRPTFETKEDSYGALGCVLVTVAALILMGIFWLFLFLGFFFR